MVHRNSPYGPHQAKILVVPLMQQRVVVMVVVEVEVVVMVVG